MVLVYDLVVGLIFVEYEFEVVIEEYEVVIILVLGRVLKEEIIDY